MRSTAGPDETQAERIEAILAGEEEWEEALEHFVASALFEVGGRTAWRWTDGIDAVHVLERGPRHLRVIATIWELPSSHSLCWLDLDAGGAAPTWTLYFDIAPDRPERFRRNAIHLISAPTDVSWAFVVKNGAREDDDVQDTNADRARV